MHYRLVYDVLNDSFPWFGAAFSSGLLLFAISHIWKTAGRLRGKTTTSLYIPSLPVVVEGALGPILLLLAALSGLYTYEGLVRRTQLQEWSRNGQYEVTEGLITGYEFRKAGSRFRVGNVTFDLLNHPGGFTNRFNIPADEGGSLRNGLQVRLAYRDRAILRVEIAADTER